MKMRTHKYRTRMIFCCAAVLLATALTGCAEPREVKTAPDSDTPAIIVGSDNYPPYNYEDADGKPAGIDVDLATEAFRRMGYRAVFTTIDWESKKELVEAGTIDCIWGSFSIDGREEQYRWMSGKTARSAALPIWKGRGSLSSLPPNRKKSSCPTPTSGFRHWRRSFPFKIGN